MSLPKPAATTLPATTVVAAGGDTDSGGVSEGDTGGALGKGGVSGGGGSLRPRTGCGLSKSSCMPSSSSTCSLPGLVERCDAAFAALCTGPPRIPHTNTDEKVANR